MAGTYAMKSHGPGGGTYMLSREEIERLIGAPVSGTFTITNVVTRKSVTVSDKRPLTDRDVARISND